MGLFDKIKEGLAKTRAGIAEKLNGLFASFRRVDEDFLEELEEALILSDMGAGCASETVDMLRERVKKEDIKEPEGIKDVLTDIIAEMMTFNGGEMKLASKPSVILVVGVNGVGKTTAIGRLAAMYRRSGKKVLLAAGDTFRAAAADQLGIWAERAGAELVRQGEGADPAAVVFDAARAAKARGSDLLIVDTAGRLHNKQNLMNELSKIVRVLARELPEADMETLLVLDATTGQNAVEQAKSFSETAGITGVVITKLDGTARGGACVQIVRTLGIPVRYIGVGEGVDDIMPFDARAFAKALFEND